MLVETEVDESRVKRTRVVKDSVFERLHTTLFSAVEFRYSTLILHRNPALTSPSLTGTASMTRCTPPTIFYSFFGPDSAPTRGIPVHCFPGYW